jgi:hypothetical protein
MKRGQQPAFVSGLKESRSDVPNLRKQTASQFWTMTCFPIADEPLMITAFLHPALSVYSRPAKTRQPSLTSIS